MLGVIGSVVTEVGSASSDAELLARVRAGDQAAFGVLYERHRLAARSLAGHLARNGADADDLVSESFTRVLRAIERGKGPDVAFRPYLLTALRRIHWERVNAARREDPTDPADLTADDHLGELFIDPALDGLDGALAVQAFTRLPERWRLVLWHTQVEQLEPAEVAPLLGITPNAVAALAYRAREALRRSFLDVHVGAGTRNETCHRVCETLPAMVRGGLSAAETAEVDGHLSDCDDCRAFYAELVGVNAGMRAFVGPAVLGPAAAGYLRDRAALTVTHPPGRSARPIRKRPDQRHAIAAAAVVTVLAAAGLAWAQVADHTTDPTTTAVPAAAPAAGTAAPPGPVATTPSAAVPAAASGPTGIPGGEPAVVSARSVTRTPPGAAGPAVLAPAPPTSAAGTPTTTPATPTTTVPPAAPADLSVEVEPVGALVAERDGILAVTVANTGPGTAPSPRLRVELPAQLTFVAATGGSWRCTPTAEGATCDRDRLAAGADQIVYLRVHAAAPATAALTATAVLTAATVDPTPASNRTTQPLSVDDIGLPATYAGQRRGDIALIGNTLASCPDTAGAACADARNRIGDDLDDNDWVTAPLDADTDPTTTSSSAATLNRPVGATVAWARLYWGADTTAGAGGGPAPAPSARGTIRFATPAAGGYQTVTAERVDDRAGRYQAAADVTALVAAAGDGTYWAADIQAGTGRDRYAAWSLAIVYDTPTGPLRRLVVFDGLAVVDTDHPARFDVSGFRTPDTGPADATLGIVAYEGDATLTGDTATIDDQTLTDSANPADNLLNSTVSHLGGPAPGRIPDHPNTFGADIDTLAIGPYVAPGARDATIDLASTGDIYLPGVLTLSVAR